MYRVSCWYVGMKTPGVYESEFQRRRCDIGDFETRVNAEQALINAAKSPEFRGGEIEEVEE